MHYCCIYGFLDLWADNIAVMNTWSGSTSVPFGLKSGAGTDPNSSIVNFHTINMLQMVPDLLQIVPVKTEVSG